MVLLLVVLTVVAGLALDYFLIRRKLATASAQVGTALRQSTGSAARSERWRLRNPMGVFLDPGHTWVYLEEGGKARVGVDEFAQSIIGSVHKVETKRIGEIVKKGDVIVSIKHDDRTATFHSPVDGLVEEINTDLIESQEMMGTSPFVDYWLYKVTPDDITEIPKTLLLGESAKQWLAREIERLKVFLSTVTPENSLVGQTLQDGGLPTWELIDALSDTDWKKLQESFFG